MLTGPSPNLGNPAYYQQPYQQPFQQAQPSPGPGAPTPLASAPAADEMDLGYYQTQLDPYGQWVEVTTNGQCWVPNQVTTNPNWRPYVDDGKWDYTDQGWYWTSDYPWGEIVFHYGRWVSCTQYHWAWVPGFDWAPSWVAWRDDSANGAVAWAPLPPSAQYQPADGLEYDGQPANMSGVDFGLMPADFVFVDVNHFWDPNPPPLVLAQDQVSVYYSSSVVRNDYVMVGGRMHMEGLGRDRMGALTHHYIVPHFANAMRYNEEHRNSMLRSQQFPGRGMRPPVHAGARDRQNNNPYGNAPPRNNPSENNNVNNNNYHPPGSTYPGYQPPTNKSQQPSKQSSQSKKKSN